MRDKVNTRALVLGTLGFICLTYSVLLPRWYISNSSGLGSSMWCDWGVKGLQCTLHGGILLGISIPMWIGTALALSALLISCFAMRGTNCCGTNCCGTNCCGDNFCGDNRRKKLFAGGCLYFISCLVTLGPVIWITVSLTYGGFRGVGECLYLAWVSVGLLMAVGLLQLNRYFPHRRKEEVTQNCTSPLEHEGEEERYGEDGEPVCETTQQEMVCLNKYERTEGDSETEPAREDSKRQYV